MYNVKLSFIRNLFVDFGDKETFHFRGFFKVSVLLVKSLDTLPQALESHNENSILLDIFFICNFNNLI